MNKTRQIFIHLLIKRTLKFYYKYFFVYFQNDTSNLVEFQVKPNFQCHAFYPVAYIISIVAPIIIYWLRIPFLWCLCNCIFLVSDCYTILQNRKMIDTCHFLLYFIGIWTTLLLLFEVHSEISFLILIRKMRDRIIVLLYSNWYKSIDLMLCRILMITQIYWRYCFKFFLEFIITTYFLFTYFVVTGNTHIFKAILI